MEATDPGRLTAREGPGDPRGSERRLTHSGAPERHALATGTHSAARRHIDGGPRHGHCYRPITMPTWNRNRFAPPSSSKGAQVVRAGPEADAPRSVLKFTPPPAS